MKKICLNLDLIKQGSLFVDVRVLAEKLTEAGYVVETESSLDKTQHHSPDGTVSVCSIVDLLPVHLITYNPVVSAPPQLLIPVVSAAVWASGLKEGIVDALQKRGYVIIDMLCDERMHKADFLSAVAFEIIAALNAPKSFAFNYVPTGNHPGAFGVKRRHHYHTGVDLYVHRNNAIVYPFEDGEIVDYGHFTGVLCGSSWWNNTHYIAVKHEKYVIVYGEVLLGDDFISPDGIVCNNHIGEKVTTKTPLGVVIPVTKNRHPEYFYHNNKMLHVEMYDAGKFRAARVDEWELDKKQPDALLDPTEYLLQRFRNSKA